MLHVLTTCDTEMIYILIIDDNNQDHTATRFIAQKLTFSVLS